MDLVGHLDFGQLSLSRMALWPTWRGDVGASGHAVEELAGRVARAHKAAPGPHAAAPPSWRSGSAENAIIRYL
ncbi:hypothetical protein OAO87_00225 [bacterium]|nr:hypothetical protein [bacterium]